MPRQRSCIFVAKAFSCIALRPFNSIPISYVSLFLFFFLLFFCYPVPRHPTAVMEPLSNPQDYVPFFKDQTIFLTGGTGGLGSCLLYKLASELPTHKIFVLCRSESKARTTWNKIMPNHINSILDSNRVKLVVGDILKPKFGIDPQLLAEIAGETTAIIHSVRILVYFSVMQARSDSQHVEH